MDSDVLIDAVNQRDMSRMEMMRRTAPERLATSVIVYGEVMTGLLRSPRPGEVERWSRIFGGFEVLDVTLQVAEAWAALRGGLRRAGLTIGDNDLLIAATALVHDMAIVTRNLRHFSRVPGLSLVLI